MRKVSLATGMSDTLIKTILSGKSRDPQLGTVEAIANALGCSPFELLRDDASRDELSALSDIAMLAVFDLRLSAGPGAWIDHDGEPICHQPVGRQWLRSLTQAPPDKIVVVCVQGDSMDPTLRDGDQILIDLTQTRPTREGIYGIRHDHSLMVKRLSVNLADKTLTIASDNKQYETLRGVNPNDITILGRVILHLRSV